ncbi:hypothetical protein [Neisseria animaloris]|uniref:hypothetical protein n=1 Tax=Neisseria animaloris TaxID=326522 RepID=UPI0039E1BEE6
MYYKEHLVLEADEKLELKERYNVKHLGQEETELYEVINGNGEVTGTVTIREHTSTKKPFNTTVRITQEHQIKEIIVDKII